MQEKSNQVFVDVIMSTAVLITASLMKLGIRELSLVPETYISGKIAQGCMKNLVKFQGWQVRQTWPSILPPLWSRKCMMGFVVGI